MTVYREFNMDVLQALNIKPENYGACSGSAKWLQTKNAGYIESINPATEKSLAKIYLCNESDYQRVVQQAQQAFHVWRQVPAPKRGELVRL